LGFVKELEIQSLIFFYNSPAGEDKRSGQANYSEPLKNNYEAIIKLTNFKADFFHVYGLKPTHDFYPDNPHKIAAISDCEITQKPALFPQNSCDTNSIKNG